MPQRGSALRRLPSAFLRRHWLHGCQSGCDEQSRQLGPTIFVIVSDTRKITDHPGGAVGQGRHCICSFGGNAHCSVAEREDHRIVELRVDHHPGHGGEADGEARPVPEGDGPERVVERRVVQAPDPRPVRRHRPLDQLRGGNLPDGAGEAQGSSNTEPLYESAGSRTS